MEFSTLIAQLRRNWRPLLLTHLSFTLLGAALLMPLFGLLLQGSITLSGTTAVVDQDIARLLLSPMGFASAVILVSILLAIVGLELGAMQVIAEASLSGRRLSAATATRYALGHAIPLLQLTLGFTLRVLRYLLPYLAAVGAIAWALLTEYDINYYLSERPPEFLTAIGAAVILAIPVVWFLGRRLLDWCLVLPLLLAGGTAPKAAFAVSSERVAGRYRACLRALLLWGLLALLLAVVPLVVLQLGMWLVLGSGSSDLTLLALGLGMLGALWSALNVLVAAMNLAGFTFITSGLYRQMAPAQDTGPLMSELAESESGQVGGISPATFAVAAALVAAVGLTAVWLVLRGVQANGEVLIIAHRGAAGSAPENTLASIRQAITDGADWVEIDVQETRDGQVVVVHDSDFMKLAGDPVKVWEGDLERLRQIDIGSWFNPQFADQRIPTLAEVLKEIKAADARLVIELKYYGHDQQLEQRVVDLVEAQDMSDRVVVMSLKLEGVQKLKKLRPDWTGGLLAAIAVGDITRLNADFLAVGQGLANPALIRRSHEAGKKIFVWTVNDALSLSHWMSMGVDGVITDEPALARDVLAQRAELSSVERLLLSMANFFGRPEALKKYRDNSP